MNILVSVNDAYLMQLTVMLTSLFKNNDCDISVWFLSEDTSLSSINMVSAFVAEKGGDFHLLEVDAFFEDFPVDGYVSKETYYRLLASELLPDDMERILWLDADTIIMRNIEDFYNMPFNGCAVCGCAWSGRISPGEQLHCKSMDISPDKYINAGVLLLNLAEWRKRDMRAEVNNLIHCGYSLEYHDQDIINIIFKDRIEYVGSVFNYLVNKQTDTCKADASIVHFCGRLKPWIFNDVPLNGLWMSYYEKSPFGGNKLHRLPFAAVSRLELLKGRKQ